MTACRAAFTRSVSVCTTMPSMMGVLQAIWSFGIFSTSTWHIRQEPSIVSFGCQQK
jgi:hypothetical protein